MREVTVQGQAGGWKEVKEAFICGPGQCQDKHLDGGREGTVAVEGTRRYSLAAWQVLLVAEPGGPARRYLLHMKQVPPACKQSERVMGALGWPGCGNQAGQ